MNVHRKQERPARELAPVEEAATANLPGAVAPSDVEPVHSSWSRLEHLYRITRLLVKFEAREKTLDAILAIITNTLPLRSAVLIDETAGHAQVFVWNSPGVTDEQISVAKLHAVDTYAYLAGSRSTSETKADASIEQAVNRRRAKDSKTANRFITIPLVVDRSPIFGAFQLEGTTPFNETDLIFINAIANQLSIALDRYKAWQFEMAARDEAEAGQRRMRFLADAARLLAASFDYRSGWESVARLAVPDIADYCFVDVVEEQSTRRIAVVAPDVRDNVAQDEVERMLTTTVSQVLKTREAIVNPATVGRPARVTRETAAASNLAIQSYMCVPLRVNDTCLGTLTLASVRSGHLYTNNDLILLEDLARRAVVSFENAHLYLDALQAVRSRDDVVNAVSHELRGPLAVVLGFVNWFLGKKPPEQSLICDREQVEAIQRSADQMNTLIEDLLDTAKIDAKHLSVQTEACAVVPIVDQAMELPRTLAANKGIQLRSEIPSDLPSIVVDRHRILQVFANLIGNAIKFTPSGGTITIRAEKREDDIQFSVEDTGAGVSVDEMSHLFDRFWQAKKTARMGTGLGLYIVKGIVEGHGGRVWVESKLGVGSKFIFTLPTSRS
jgi:signal transduction histidine kinase